MGSRPEDLVPALKVERLVTGLIGPVSFAIPANSCATLMGASGSGKSLLLRAIVDLDPNTGAVFCGGRARDQMSAAEWRRLVALVPAESGWWADHVRDHFPRASDAEELLEALGLGNALDWDVRRLSTGERQRLAVARAVCRKPSVLLLDEPTASLDEQATGLLEQLVRRCCASGMAVLVVTHDRRQADRLAGQRLMMVDGTVESH
jgi:ABC-type multidrug transport system ATPase subunit